MKVITMNEKAFISNYLRECAEYLSNIDVSDDIIMAKKIILNAKQSGGKIMFAGNGASASIASHASLDFTKQAKVKSVNFNEAAFVTALSNDFGYENWMQKAVEFYSDPDDVLVLISSSGASNNIINCAKYAKSVGIKLITFSGFSESNFLKSTGDINFWIDSRAYNMIEGIHQVWLLAICDLIIGKSEYTVS